ncbi:MAG: serine hydrolase domain-containing protein [Pseudomonadota bacterium]
MTAIHGTCAPDFAAVKAAFEANFAQRDDIGASVAVSFKGEMVVDLWGGALARGSSEPWQEDTIVNVWSTTKTMAALSLLVLADKGEIDFAAPVARYWPEFAAAGKDSVTVAHVMSHQAGLSGMDQPVEGATLYDWDFMTRELAAQAPWWEPGTGSGYHALTQGYLQGEIVRRVTGQTLGAFFKHEIADPLGADFQIGVSEASRARIGALIPPTSTLPGPDDDSIAARTIASPKVVAAQCNEHGWQVAEIPAANGHGNARSVVRVQTALANGGEAWGKRILSEAGARRVMEEQCRGVDQVLGTPGVFGLGYGINSDLMPLAPNPNVCFWGGYGGSLILVDQDARMCVSYVMNRMEPGIQGDLRGMSIAMAAYQALAMRE